MQVQYAKRMQFVRPSAIRELFKLGVDPSVISFGGGYPDPNLFPVEKLSIAFQKVLLEQGHNALQYTTTDGLIPLREKLIKRMVVAGIKCAIENLIIIQGGQQGLDLVAKMFINEGDVIITENPTFLGALIAFNPCMPRYAVVSVDKDGMCMDELETTLKSNPQTKFIYTIPEFQNPTGITMSFSRRKRIVELANEYNVMILEDSPYREIRFEGEALPAIKSFDTEGRVIHLGSFSKILCPGVRLGWLIAEARIAEKLCLLKMAADTQNSTLNMYAVNMFMDLFDLDAHIEIIRSAYKCKKDLMLSVIRSTFPDCIRFTDPEGGLFTWLTFPKYIDATKLMYEHVLPEVKVAYVPGGTFFPVVEEANHCRMNYTCMSDEKIVDGITKLGVVFRNCL